MLCTYALLLCALTLLLLQCRNIDAAIDVLMHRQADTFISIKRQGRSLTTPGGDPCVGGVDMAVLHTLGNMSHAPGGLHTPLMAVGVVLLLPIVSC